MIYNKIKFTVGLESIVYQEIEENTNVVIRYCDDNGNTIELPEVTESEVIEINAKPKFVK